MAKNDLVLLDSILTNYSGENPDMKEDEVFEFFTMEQVLKDYLFSRQEIMQGSVDGRNDGGIDGFFIIVNGHLAETIPQDYWPKTNADIEIYLFTCKHEDSFKQAPITTMIPSIIQLFDFRLSSSNLVEYNQKVIEKRELLISTYRRLAAVISKFDIHIIYACRGDERIENNIKAKADQIEEICNESFSECVAKFEFWGNSKLLERYRERINKSAELQFEQCINQDGQYIVLARIKNYYEFLLDD